MSIQEILDLIGDIERGRECADDDYYWGFDEAIEKAQDLIEQKLTEAGFDEPCAQCGTRSH